MPRSFAYSRPKKDPEESLLEYLVKKFHYLTQNEWEKHVGAGHLSVRNKGAKAAELVRDTGHVLKQGDVITFSPPAELEPEVDTEHIKKIYEDAFILVVAKNGCLPVSEGGRYCLNTLVSVLQRGEHKFHLEGGGPQSSTDPHGQVKRQKVENSFPELYSVHRLDKETSGIVVLAKTKQSAKALSAFFMEKSNLAEPQLQSLRNLTSSARATEDKEDLEKTYIAVLIGSPEEGKVFINNSRIGLLSENPQNCGPQHQKLKKLKMFCYPAESEFGKTAYSRIKILSSDSSIGLCVASVYIYTGRSHQIRVHCADIGYPVLGDKLYSTREPGQQGFLEVASDEVYIDRAKRERGYFHKFNSLSGANVSEKTWLLQRHLLHAAKLVFPHPESGESLHFEESPHTWFMNDVRCDVAEDLTTLSLLIEQGWKAAK